VSVCRACLGVLLIAGMLVSNAEYGVAQTGQMPKPENHQADDFWLTHGQGGKADASLCAVCHARDYCARCHVNPYDNPVIQALSSDPEVAEYVAGKEWPAPPTHTPFYLEDHKAPGAAATSNCQVCHVIEQQCQSCHLGSETLERPRSKTDVDLFHPLNFMQQHSTAAWNQETECATCHNPEVFCRDCHTNLGYASGAFRTTSGFHNGSVRFRFGHGQAARQGLESCATCHAQQDCLQCHSAISGRRINPHGPGFDAEKLRSKNEGLCLLCHFSVPEGG
jgi:hypothetical protein